MSECWECGRDLGHDPEMLCASGRLDGYIEFTYSVPGGHETEVFCSPSCFAEEYGPTATQDEPEDG